MRRALREKLNKSQSLNVREVEADYLQSYPHQFGVYADGVILAVASSVARSCFRLVENGKSAILDVRKLGRVFIPRNISVDCGANMELLEGVR